MRWIDRLTGYTEKRGYRVYSLSEARDEDSITTVEPDPDRGCRDIYSVAKLYTATALGLLYDRGIVFPEEKVCDILADQLPVPDMDERWRTATVDHALRHRLGLPHGYLDIDTDPIAKFGKDFLSSLFLTPPEYCPGEERSYSDGAYYLIGRIITERSGMKPDDLLWESLLSRIGTQEAAWGHCPMGYPLGGTSVYTRSADMVRLGLVYLNRGLWRGERLLSSEWTGLAMRRCYGFDPDDREGIVRKDGMYGQSLMILPAQHRVVAVQSFGADTDDIAAWCLAHGND